MAESRSPSTKKLIDRGISAWERDDYASALASFREVVERHPNFADVRNKVGLCLAMLGDSEGALAEFDHAVRVNPAYVEAHLNRSIILNELGEFRRARESFATAGELDERMPGKYPAYVGHRIAEAHSALGDLYLVADDPERAVEQFDAGLELRPGFVDIRARLATALLAVGNASRAREELSTILETNPGFTSARILLGVALRRMGDEKGARDEWERAAAQAPQDLRARAYLSSLDPKGPPEGSQVPDSLQPSTTPDG